MPDDGPPRRPWDPDFRTTLCTACAAPFRVPLDGGPQTCPACGTTTELRPRDLRPVRFDAPADEAQRLERLRAQDGKPLLPPPGLEPLCDGGVLLESRVPEALLAWRDARRSLQATGDPLAAERLVFLTLVMENRPKKTGGPLARRAFLESGLDAAASFPALRQDFLGRLSRAACRAGDLRSAERWLDLCDPRPDDLPADSSWRVSRAQLDTARRDFSAVLGVLGEDEHAVPFQDAMDIYATMYRAHALEQTGRLDDAVRQLTRRMKRPADRTMVLRFVETLHLCAAAHPRALALVEKAAAADSAGRGGLTLAGVLALVGAGLIVLGLGWIGLHYLDYTGRWDIFDAPPGDPSFEGDAFGVFLFHVVTGIGILLWAWRERRRGEAARRLRTRGAPARAEVRSLDETGTSVSGRTEYKVELTVRTDDRPPYEASTILLLDPLAAEKLVPGTVVHVRVDPDDPSHVLIETLP